MCASLFMLLYCHQIHHIPLSYSRLVRMSVNNMYLKQHKLTVVNVQCGGPVALISYL